MRYILPLIALFGCSPFATQAIDDAVTGEAGVIEKVAQDLSTSPPSPAASVTLKKF